jgi:hypothetical protein
VLPARSRLYDLACTDQFAVFAVTTNGRFDPVKINQITARYEITYEE